MAQWIRILLSVQGTWVRSWSGKIPHTERQLSPGATSSKPASPRVCAVGNRRSHHNEKAKHCKEILLVTTREIPPQAMKTQSSKKLKKKKGQRSKTIKKKNQTILQSKRCKGNRAHGPASLRLPDHPSPQGREWQWTKPRSLCFAWISQQHVPPGTGNMIMFLHTWCLQNSRTPLSCEAQVSSSSNWESLDCSQ